MSATTSTRTLPCCPVPGCPHPIDLLIEASDKRRLGAHREHLKAFNATFPIISPITHLIKVPETYDVLVVLLVFSHYEYQYPKPKTFVSVSGLGLDTILDLAVAAEEYGNCVVGLVAREAMNYLGKQSAENALRVIPYKIIHSDYTDMDEILLMTMYSPLSAAREVMEPYPDVFDIYFNYKSQWRVSFSRWTTQVNTIDEALKDTDPRFVLVKHILESTKYPSVDVVNYAEKIYSSDRDQDQITTTARLMMEEGPMVLKTWEYLFFDKLRERARGFKTWEEFVRSPRRCYELEPEPTEYFTRWDYW